LSTTLYYPGICPTNGVHYIISIESIAQYEHKPAANAILLNDFIIDKKVIDIEDRDVSIVYDVKILQIMQKLYVSDVVVNKYGFLRHIGLRSLAELLGIKEDLVSWRGI
jgi:magnesium transporter